MDQWVIFQTPHLPPKPGENLPSCDKAVVGETPCPLTPGQDPWCHGQQPHSRNKKWLFKRGVIFKNKCKPQMKSLVFDGISYYRVIPELLRIIVKVENWSETSPVRSTLSWLRIVTICNKQKKKS